MPLIMQFFGMCGRRPFVYRSYPESSAAGLGVTTILNSVSTLLVDLYPKQAASATAANNLYRCLCGAAGTAIIEPLINAIGEGQLLRTNGCGTLLTSCFLCVQAGPSPFYRSCAVR